MHYLETHLSLDVFEHHLSEFIEGDLTITVGVNLSENLLDNFLVEVLAEGEHLLDLIHGNGTTTVLVEHLEG